MGEEVYGSSLAWHYCCCVDVVVIKREEIP